MIAAMAAATPNTVLPVRRKGGGISELFLFRFQADVFKGYRLG
jgi:hypothetical protein